MGYCVKSDIYPAQIPTADLIQLLDDTGLKTEMDEALEAIVDGIIEDVSARIDGYCQKVYTVPLSPVPRLIKVFAVDMAIYSFYPRRNLEIPKLRADRYNEAIAYLEKLATESNRALGAATPAETSSANEVSISSNTGEFTRAKLQDF